MEAVQKTPEREAFYKKIDGENLSALWNVMGDLITPEPRSACRPHLWKFDQIRDYMTEAGKLITAKEAERRVLVLENPGLRGQSKITTSLGAVLRRSTTRRACSKGQALAAAARVCKSNIGESYRTRLPRAPNWRHPLRQSLATDVGRCDFSKAGQSATRCAP